MTWPALLGVLLFWLPVPAGGPLLPLPGDPGDPGAVAPAGRWSESDEPSVARWTDALGRPLAAPGVVVSSPEDQRALVASAPPAVRADVAGVLASVDPATEVAVVGGFHRCTEESRVDDLALTVVEVDPDTDCGWSPWTVDLHVVPR